jgi:hypothetical protein
MIYTFNGDINKGIVTAARRRNTKNGKSGGWLSGFGLSRDICYLGTTFSMEKECAVSRDICYFGRSDSIITDLMKIDADLISARKNSKYQT